MKRKWIALSGAVLVPTAACIPLAITTNKVYKIEDYDVEGRQLTWNPYDEDFDVNKASDKKSQKEIVQDFKGDGLFQEITTPKSVVCGGGGEKAQERIKQKYKDKEKNFKPMGLTVQVKYTEQQNGGGSTDPWGTASVGFSGDDFCPIIDKFQISKVNFKRLLEEAEGEGTTHSKSWSIYDQDKQDGTINSKLLEGGGSVPFEFKINKNEVEEKFNLNEIIANNVSDVRSTKITNPSGMNSQIKNATYKLSNKDVKSIECYTRASEIAKFVSAGGKTVNWPLEEIKNTANIWDCGNINVWYDMTFMDYAIQGGFIFNFTEWLKHLWITITRINENEAEILISEKEIEEGYKPFWYMTYWKNEYLNISVAEGFRWSYDNKNNKWVNNDLEKNVRYYGISNTMGNCMDWVVSGAEWGKMLPLKKNSNGSYERQWWRFPIKFTNPLDPSK